MAIDIEMSFEDYLTGKNIDSLAFKKGDAALYTEWEALFKKIHPNSFTLQKKFLINATRLKYLLKD